MDQAQLEQLLVQLIREQHELSGNEKAEVTAATRPTKDLPGFDSMACVQATIAAAGELKKELDFTNVFIDGHKALSISEVAAERLLGSREQKAK